MIAYVAIMRMVSKLVLRAQALSLEGEEYDDYLRAALTLMESAGRLLPAAGDLYMERRRFIATFVTIEQLRESC